MYLNSIQTRHVNEKLTNLEFITVMTTSLQDKAHYTKFQHELRVFLDSPCKCAT